VSAASKHTCAVQVNKTAWCWGDNLNGQLGNMSNTDSFVPVAAMGVTTAVQVVAMQDTACALLADGTVTCWGENGRGQLGLGTLVDSNVPVPVPGVMGVAELSAGGNFVCARHLTGAVTCWGYGLDGHLGNGGGPPDDFLTPQAFQGSAGTAMMGTANSATCLLDGAGALRCWGFASYGQLGGGAAKSLRPMEAIRGPL
jgi:alpha-tubulin suppressor-like RCC1 family protein